MKKPNIKSKVMAYVYRGPHKGAIGRIIDSDQHGNVTIAVEKQGTVTWITVDYNDIEKRVFFS